MLLLSLAHHVLFSDLLIVCKYFYVCEVFFYFLFVLDKLKTVFNKVFCFLLNQKAHLS